VLVVEDEPALRELTRRILERNGYRALVAADGPEALKTAQDPGVEIDLLLTDVVMPHMLGKDLAARLRLRYPDVPVLYMSGYAQPVLTNQGTLEPDVTLIEKPFTEPALLARIREVFAAASTRRPSGR
jgi:CheY-like chemotaxis protein